MQVCQVYFNRQQTVNPAVLSRKTAAGCRFSAVYAVDKRAATRVPNRWNPS